MEYSRKEICEFVYAMGGLAVAIVMAICLFVNYTNDGLMPRIMISIILGLMTAPIGGCILGGITYLVLLPFRKKIPWHIPHYALGVGNGPVPIEDEPIVFEPIHDRYEILDL